MRVPIIACPYPIHDGRTRFFNLVFRWLSYRDSKASLLNDEELFIHERLRYVLYR